MMAGKSYNQLLKFMGSISLASTITIVDVISTQTSF